MASKSSYHASYDPDDDPDREVNPIILQFMAKSTLRAVLSDKNALSATMAKRGIDSNTASMEDLTDKVFTQMQNEKMERVRALQRQFLMFLMEGDKDQTELLRKVFAAFKQNTQEQKDEKLSVLNQMMKKSKHTKSAPDFGRLMKGMRANQKEEHQDGFIGCRINILDTRDNRSKVKNLTILRESAKGEGFELSDHSYLFKKHEGTKWVLVDSRPDLLARLPEREAETEKKGPYFIPSPPVSRSASKESTFPVSRSGSKESTFSRTPSKEHPFPVTGGYTLERPLSRTDSTGAVRRRRPSYNSDTQDGYSRRPSVSSQDGYNSRRPSANGVPDEFDFPKEAKTKLTEKLNDEKKWRKRYQTIE